MGAMGPALWGTVLVACFRLALFADSTPSCIIELECRECLPDHMPLVTSHAARGGRVAAAHGAELRLSCGRGELLAYPGRSTVRAACEAGRLRVAEDGALRHLLEMGCQEDVFEDVLHHVPHCGAPLQGRAYQTQSQGATRHLAALCSDADRAVTARAHIVTDELPLPRHTDNLAPLTLLGNFNHMFDTTTRKDAEALFSDDVSANKRLRELVKHDLVSLGEQSLTAARLLAPHYFQDQDARVTDFVSNKVVSWRSVVHGNWRHLQHDVQHALHTPGVQVAAGTHGEVSLRGAGGAVRVRVRGGRFPAPKYLWTAVMVPAVRAGVAIVVLNDPFVAVSEIKDAVFCESMCSSISWLHELRRNRNYETPVLGLTFCCSLNNFTDIVEELPKDFVPHLDRYTLLTDLDLKESDKLRNGV